MNTHTLDLDSNGTVDKIESIIIKHSKEFGSESPLILDMSRIDFITVETLVFLTSFISKRKSANLITKLKYPENPKVRTFLYSSRFFHLIEEVAQINIKDLVIDLPGYFDKTYLSFDRFEKRRNFVEIGGQKRELTDEDYIEYLKKTGFYPLVSLPFEDDSQKSITLKEEPNNWTGGKPLISIIQKNLPEDVIIGDKISKHIIYESITNSIRHPKSTKLVVSCIASKGFYTLVIWDNGESIVDTLINALKNDKPIKIETSLIDDNPHSCYCIPNVEITGRPKVSDFDFRFSFEVPDLKNNEVGKEYIKQRRFILLAALFPGISRDPYGLDYEKIEHIERPQLTGRGLTYLINTAVRSLGGEVRIRTGNYFINIKKAEKAYLTLPNLFFNEFKDKYYVIDMKEKYIAEGITPNGKTTISSLFKAKLKKLDEGVGDFYGNMITIHIPQNN